MQQLQDSYYVKKDSIGPHKLYLGAEIKKIGTIWGKMHGCQVTQNMLFIAAISQHFVNHCHKTHYDFSFANHKVTTYLKLVPLKTDFVTVPENILTYSKVIR